MSEAIEKSKYHILNVYLVNGELCDEVQITMDYPTKYESEVVKCFFNKDIFCYGGSWFPINKVIRVVYKGIDVWRHVGAKN